MLKQWFLKRSKSFQIGEEEKKQPEKVTWDGHTASMEAATRAARANITIEEQIQQIHKIKGLLPDEEKERIGPTKPNAGATIMSGPISNPTISSTPQTIVITTISSGPKPSLQMSGSSTMTPNPAPTVSRPPMPQPPMPVPPPGHMGMMHQQAMMQGPPGMHMMGPMGGPMQHPSLMGKYIG